ncbi:MAG: CPBP family intramembrane metalloprotease [Clostridia bacterium]|nr:CPBP family intramembrane metalloprotease [Clostridia bacterium]
MYSAVILIVCTGFLEELIFRGMIYRAAKEKMGTKQSLILVSLINAAMHISNLSFLHVVFVFLLAVLIT